MAFGLDIPPPKSEACNNSVVTERRIALRNLYLGFSIETTKMEKLV